MAATTTTDILVLGYGLAGAATAAQAIEDARAAGTQVNVLLLDRLGGGGSSRRSGGVVYFGGGTDLQRALRIEDSPEDMYAYLLHETGGSVREETLWRFCCTSAESGTWMRDVFAGMRLNRPDGLLCPYKTSKAMGKYALYYSGSENANPFAKVARPAQRGHQAVGPDNAVGTGNTLFDDVERGIRERFVGRGLTLETYTRAVELIWGEEEGGEAKTTARRRRIVGAKVVSISLGAPFWVRSLYSFLAWYGSLENPYNFADDYIASTLDFLERRFGAVRNIYAKRGVVICTGGFGRHSGRVREHIPGFYGCMPIGTMGDMGDGIFDLGARDAGAATNLLSTACAWKFIAPAASMNKGVLVNRHGTRLENEESYGARLAGAMMKNEGMAFLVLDQKIKDACMSELATDEMLVFQKLFTVMNTMWNNVKADTIEELVRMTGMTQLPETLEQYNRGCDEGEDAAFGKNPKFLSRIDTGPFYAVKFHSHGTVWMTPYFTLGGLVVSEDTGQVLDREGKAIPGLFAAGRAACGIPSKSYVTGLSLADCLYSGRRAGRFLALGSVFGAECDAIPRPYFPSAAPQSRL